MIKDIKDVDRIVSYSLFQMPTDNTERLKIFKKIIKQKKSIFFALEDLKISTMEEIDDINNLWLIKKSLVNQKQINKNDKIFKNKNLHKSLKLIRAVELEISSKYQEYEMRCPVPSFCWPGGCFRRSVYQILVLTIK